MLENKHSIVIDPSLTLEYALIYSKRKTFSLAIMADRTIIVRAPLKTPQIFIESFIAKQAKWIQKKLAKIEQLPVKVLPKFTTGEMHLFLGQFYPLKLIEGTYNQVILSNNKIEITSLNKSPEILLENWYKQEAQQIFQQRFEDCWPLFLALDYPRPKITVKKMKSRWGSLIAKKRISLNQALIKGPIVLIDYVIIHELCHLLHGGHDQQYYNLLGKLIPNWKKLKKELKQIPL